MAGLKDEKEWKCLAGMMKRSEYARMAG